MSRHPWASRRWTIIALGMVVLLAMHLLGAAESVLAPLAMGIGGAMTALQAGESWVDRTRVRYPGAPPSPRAPDVADPRGECHHCDHERRHG